MYVVSRIVLIPDIQLDSIAFFPYLSWGANNELAGVATLMAVLQTIGKLKADVRS